MAETERGAYCELAVASVIVVVEVRTADASAFY
jgi:hypothetical protein